MKNFTEENVTARNNPYTNEPLHSLSCDKHDLLLKPLWFHELNLSQTATGYGKALKTRYMIRFENRLLRVLYDLYSNSGTLYIKTKRYGDIIIDCVS